MVLIIDSVVKPTYNELVASPCVYTYVYTLCVKVILYLYVYFKRLYWSPSNKQWKIRLSPTGCQIRISILGFDNPWPNKKYKCVCVCLCICSYLIIYICVCEKPREDTKIICHSWNRICLLHFFGLYIIYIMQILILYHIICMYTYIYIIIWYNNPLTYGYSIALSYNIVHIL